MRIMACGIGQHKNVRGPSSFAVRRSAELAGRVARRKHRYAFAMSRRQRRRLLEVVEDYYRVPCLIGARRFRSSNQFSTTFSLAAVPGLWDLGSSIITKRLPSGAMS